MKLFPVGWCSSYLVSMDYSRDLYISLMLTIAGLFTLCDFENFECGLLSIV